MTDVLFELGCEELPPLALYDLADALFNGVCDALRAQEIEFDANASRAYATPRRLAFALRNISDRQPDRVVEKRGPSVDVAFDASGQPKPAALGFARSLGVEVSDLGRLKTDKGEWLALTVTEHGQSIEECLPPIIAEAIRRLPIPRPMRWADHAHQFIRPVHWLVLLKDREVMPMQLFGLNAERTSRGHRFHHPQPVQLASAQDYEAALEAAHVRVCPQKRRDIIRQQTTALGETLGGEALIEEALLNEVSAIVEWPVALAGAFDSDFLDVPDEALISSMQKHQKYFPVTDASGALLPHFIACANLESKDPSVVVEGFEKVITPRLADARFFWRQDCKRPLSDYVPLLANMIFESSLGSLVDKCTRVGALMQWLGESLSFDAADAQRAAQLMKCDLMSDMVGEFPDLQGIMGGHYARVQGESQAVADAIRDQYRPGHAGDALPQTVLGQALSLADKVDTLCGIFAVGKKPSGSKDPFGLRRAGLGIIALLKALPQPIDYFALLRHSIQQLPDTGADPRAVFSEVSAFIEQRMKHQYRDTGVDHDVVDAVLAIRPRSVPDVEKRMRATQAFKQLSQAESLIQINKRIKNILKNDAQPAQRSVDPKLFSAPAENALHAAMQNCTGAVDELHRAGDYAEALKRCCALQQPLAQFFDDVLVNDEDQAIKNNRMALLSNLYDMLNRIVILDHLNAGGQ